MYAYVSRGRLRSRRIAEFNGSLFPVDEIEAAVSAGARPRTPAGVTERIRTQLTYLHSDRLYYRGTDVIELAADRSFEEVAELLWQAQWNPKHQLAPGAARIGAAVNRLCGERSRALDRVRIAVDLAGARDSRRGRTDQDAVAAKASYVIDAAVAALGPGPDVGSLASRLWPRLTDMTPRPALVRLLDATLVVLADHDMSAGAVAARVAASARGSIYAVIGAGLGAFDGPMHGGATTLASEFLAAACDDPSAAVADAGYPGKPIPGTGHVIYARSDPRADFLIARLAGVRGGDRRADAALDAITQALQPPDFVNSDLALAAVALRFRMRPDAAEAIFAIARMVGWTAHALEEYQEPRLRFRPEGIYTGIRPRGRSERPG